MPCVRAMAIETTLLRTLQAVLGIEEQDPRAAMTEAADLVASAIGAEKVDVFVLDPQRDELVALGTSETPLGQRERALGLDRLKLAEGGRTIHVFRTGEPYLTQDRGRDAVERDDIWRILGVRSTVQVPLTVEGERRGVLAIASTAPGAFEEAHLELAQAIARWIGTVLHRAELSEQARGAREEGRRAAQDLVTVLAHDVRNLLSPIAGRVALLKRRAERDGRDPDRRDCEAAERSVRAVTKLVENLLDVTRIDRGLFELRRGPVDLVAAATEVAGSVSMADREVIVRGPRELVISADATRLRQVLENLVSNAVRYTPAGQRVDVDIEALDRGARAAVRVRDRGPGIPPELLPMIFRPFERERRSGGLGLGLFLAHEIVRAHGGELTVESTPGAGSTFTFTVPVDDPHR